MCIRDSSSRVALETLKRDLAADKSWDLVCVLSENGGVFGRDRENNELLELLPSTAPDARKLLVYSILVRDHVQNARAYRLVAGLEDYINFDNSSATKFG